MNKSRYGEGNTSIDWSKNFRGDHLHGCIFEYENDPQCGKYHYIGDSSGICRYHKWKRGELNE